MNYMCSLMMISDMLSKHVGAGKSVLKKWFNPLNAKLNPICHLLALLGSAIIVVVSRLRVKINDIQLVFVGIVILSECKDFFNCVVLLRQLKQLVSCIMTCLIENNRLWQHDHMCFNWICVSCMCKSVTEVQI